MKRLIILILLAGCFTIVAQIPESMRSAASDGLFEGEMDDLYDSVKLGKTDSIYFLTNFSDFSYRYNDVFEITGENSENRFLEELPFGLAFSNPLINNMRHSLYIRFNNILTPKNTGSDTERYLTSYEDLDEDDNIDIKVVTYESENNFECDKSKLDFIWNNSFSLKEWDLGIRYSSFVIDENYDDAQGYYGEYDFDPLGYIHGASFSQSSFEIEKEIYHYEEDELYYDISEKGDFNTDFGSVEKELLISFERPNSFLITDSRLRLNLGYKQYDDLFYDKEDCYTAEYEYFTSERGTEEGSLEEVIDEDNYINQRNIYVSGKLKKEMNAKFAGEAGFYEFYLSGGIHYGENDSNCNSTRVLVKSITDSSGVNIESEEESMVYGHINEGEFSGFDIKTSYRLNLPLNENALFGIGVSYKYVYSDYETDYSYNHEEIESVLDGSEFDDLFDYVKTSTAHYESDKQSIIYESETRLPIALEFRISKDDLSNNDGFSLRNFVYRLGTTLIYKTEKMDDRREDVLNEGCIVLEEYGNGLVDELHYDEFNIDSAKSELETHESMKRFSAGIGYRHSENVSIDLAGYYDATTEDYFIGLSFTIKK